MNPTRVIEMRAELLERARNDLTFQKYVAGTLVEQFREGNHLNTERVRAQVMTSMNSLVHAVRAAEAYHVSADMTQIVQAAAGALDSTDRWDTELAPSHSGIVRFDGGLKVTDIRGQVMHLDWLVWQRSVFQTVATHPAFDENPATGMIGPGANWFEFNDAIDNPDQVSLGMPDGIRIYGRWGFAGMNVATDGQRVGPETIYPSETLTRRIREDGDPVCKATNTVRLLHAFWLLLGQQITVTSHRKAHPVVAKRLGKARLPKSKGVTVIELRKHKYTPGDGHRQVEWDHRWLVRGFWRWQPCGPGRTERKRVWIHDYIKGPDDLPLVIKNRVMDLRR